MCHYEKIPHISENNPSIQCASKAIKITSNSEMGRHVIAERNIKPGEVLAVEEPYAKILLDDQYATHCYHCLAPSYCLIPCRKCPSVLFCSESCRKSSWDEYHKHECPILGTLLKLQVAKLPLLALRVTMCAKSEYKNIKSFGKAKGVYESGKYEEIHELIGNEHVRLVPDIFTRACGVAVKFTLLKKHTQFFETPAQEDVFKELLLKNSMVASSNFHQLSELCGRQGGAFQIEEIGAGAYSFLSLLNHSCNPNVVRHCYGSTLVLRALRPIKKGDQLFDNYG